MWSVASGHLCLLFLIVVPCCLCSPGNVHSCSFAQGTPTWDPELRASRCLGKTAAKLAGRNVAPSTKKSAFTSTAMRREPVLYKQASNRGFISEAEPICCFFRKSSPGFPSKDCKIFPSPLRFIDLLKKVKERASKRNIFFLSTVWLPKKPWWPVLCQARARSLDEVLPCSGQKPFATPFSCGLAGGCIGSQAARTQTGTSRGYQCYKLRFHELHHSSSTIHTITCTPFACSLFLPVLYGTMSDADGVLCFFFFLVSSVVFCATSFIGSPG